GAEHGVGELLFLSAALAARIGVVLEFAAVFAPALRRREGEPLPHVRDLGGPALIDLAAPFAPTEAIDDELYLLEFGFRVALILGTCQRSLGAGAQVFEKVADLLVGAERCFELNVAAGIVVDSVQGAVDGLDALADGLALPVELRLKVRYFA